MDKDEPRFFCKREPSGNWAVWDSVQNGPATLGGGPPRGREEIRARSACKILNAIYRSQLDADSVRERNGVEARSGAAHDRARPARPQFPHAQEETIDSATNARGSDAVSGHIRAEFTKLKATGRVSPASPEKVPTIPWSG
ncbi:hypothetical protein [Mesorhizobium sp. CN2-181]|uniref:hypothetical protein n=1 Tax=Mesorhizobium yinganensis TaxID=3157707 RepID=UPI0032B7D920